MKRLCLALILLAGGCASTSVQFLPNPLPNVGIRRAPDQIEILYDGPGRPYDVVGLLNVFRYAPGFSGPPFIDVVPEIKAKASEVGGDAVIVRNTSTANRNLNVDAEVIRYRD